jgi:hypothetical protein
MQSPGCLPLSKFYTSLDYQSGGQANKNEPSFGSHCFCAWRSSTPNRQYLALEIISVCFTHNYHLTYRVDAK